MGKKRFTLKSYDYIIVGCGLYGAMSANLLVKAGKSVLIIDKRDHMGGNLYCENVNGIFIHKYGPHIFHTSRRDVWDFVNSIVEFVPYVNSPVANYKGELYNLPFNMNTFYKLWKVKTPEEALYKIKSQRSEYASVEPENLEEQAMKLVGRDIYEKLIKGYTEKQWGRKCSDLPASIIQRIPLRFTYDNNYFNDIYQGIPQGGYNKFIEVLIQGADLKLMYDFSKIKDKWRCMAHKLIYTGRIDEFFDYRLGHLDYRSLRFEHKELEANRYQGVAVMNFTDNEMRYTRIIEHKHFDRSCMSENTIITKEYPTEFNHEDSFSEPYYPINDSRNTRLYQNYRKMADEQENITFGGRLGEYKYYNMDQIIGNIMDIMK